MMNGAFWKWLAGLALGCNAFFLARTVNSIDFLVTEVQAIKVAQARMEERIIRLYGAQGWQTSMVPFGSNRGGQIPTRTTPHVLAPAPKTETVVAEGEEFNPNLFI
jgi:hypothetical protein